MAALLTVPATRCAAGPMPCTAFTVASLADSTSATGPWCVARPTAVATAAVPKSPPGRGTALLMERPTVPMRRNGPGLAVRVSSVSLGALSIMDSFSLISSFCCSPFSTYCATSTSFAVVSFLDVRFAASTSPLLLLLAFAPGQNLEIMPVKGLCSKTSSALVLGKPTTTSPNTRTNARTATIVGKRQREVRLNSFAYCVFVYFNSRPSVERTSTVFSQ
mmetsp:Transcript_39544/g.64984  ORF Transcript_39544/g.64984 Transcript_39544/m.64984 type:complete len:219 (-) Transcript_39544:212-868(-)